MSVSATDASASAASDIDELNADSFADSPDATADMGDIAAVLDIFGESEAVAEPNGSMALGASTGVMDAPDAETLASMTEPGKSGDDLSLPASDAASDMPEVSAESYQARDDSAEQSGAVSLENPPAAEAKSSRGPLIEEIEPDDASSEADTSGQPAAEMPAEAADAGQTGAYTDEQQELARIWLQEMNTHIDNGFAWLDRSGVGQAEKTFWYVASRLDDHPELARELMAGLLEGSVETARLFADSGYTPEAIRLLTKVCFAARKHLADNFNADAWAWWGDAERLTGTMMHAAGQPQDAAAYLMQARTIFYEMLQRSNNPEARVDVFRISASRAALLTEMGMIPEAMEEYRIAIDNGLQTLVDGFREDMAVASLHVARGRLAIETGQLELACHDYGWALETYEHLFADDMDCVMEMCTARAGLAEACAYLGDMPKMKEHFRGLLACRAQLDSEGQYERVQVLDDLLENLNELGRSIFG